MQLEDVGDGNDQRDEWRVTENSPSDVREADFVLNYDITPIVSSVVLSSTYCTNCRQKAKNIICELSVANTLVDNLRCLLEKSEQEFNRKTEDVKLLNKKVKELESLIINLECKIINENNLLKDVQILKFYTGFASVSRYLCFKELVKAALEYNYPDYFNLKKKGRKKILCFEDELIMFLCRIRHCLLEKT